jgi:hypothetical protein
MRNGLRATPEKPSPDTKFAKLGCAVIGHLRRAPLRIAVILDIEVGQEMHKNELYDVSGIVARRAGMETCAKCRFRLRQAGELELVGIALNLTKWQIVHLLAAQVWRDTSPLLRTTLLVVLAGSLLLLLDTYVIQPYFLSLRRLGVPELKPIKWQTPIRLYTHA